MHLYSIAKDVERGWGDYILYIVGPPGVLGIWGEWLFIFRELGSTGNNFRGAREQANNFGDLGSCQKNKEKPPFCLIF